MKFVNGNFIGEYELINCNDSVISFKGKAKESGYYMDTATLKDKSVYKKKLSQNFDYTSNGVYESNDSSFIFSGE